MKEIWKDVKDYEGLYQVSNKGKIKSLRRKTTFVYKRGGQHTISEKYIKLFKNKYGYLKCYLYKSGKREIFQLHRIVAEAFIPNPDNLPQVNHKDENKSNNNINNLEWCTNKYNAEYSKNKAIIQYDKNSNKITEWRSQLKASKKTGISNKDISLCCRGKRKTAGGYIWKFKEDNNE